MDLSNGMPSNKDGSFVSSDAHLNHLGLGLVLHSADILQSTNLLHCDNLSIYKLTEYGDLDHIFKSDAW